jgi:hypothetical protein
MESSSSVYHHQLDGWSMIQPLANYLVFTIEHRRLKQKIHLYRNYT